MKFLKCHIQPTDTSIINFQNGAKGMKFWTRNNLKSEKGNSLLIALSVILTLTSFGTVALMTSVANIQMSAKYRNWTKDYYSLDVDAEGKVNQVNSLLEKAEGNAQSYMAGQYYLSPTVQSSGDLQITPLAQTYINDQWNSLVAPYLDNMNGQDYKKNLPIFTSDILKRLYFYFASEELHASSYGLITIDGSDMVVSNYQDALFNNSDPQILEDGKLAVKLNSNTVNGKSVEVILNVLFPTYSTIQQAKDIKFRGNPIWANAITAAGSIGFVNGSSTVQGDLFSADKDESLYLDDNKVYASGVYSDGADVKIYGNVYSKGNLHIIRSGSEIDVNPYQPGFQTTLKNNVFSDNGLFFDNSDSAAYPKDYTYIQTDPNNDTPLYFVNQDITGGNIYCNSLSVDHSADNQRVDNGKINIDGNVSTFNDIKMNNSVQNADNTYSDGSGSAITVLKNFIGINSSGHNGDPNANSTVINNTALAGNKIYLEGKIIVPGTAWAEYKGVKKKGWSRFFWPDSTNPSPPEDWASQQYYQTGESITAKNADIYSAYMGPVINPDPAYTYSYEPFTLDTNPQDLQPSQQYDEQKINSFYLMRGDNKNPTPDEPDQDSITPKESQLADYIISKEASGTTIVSNIFSGTTVEGYSLAEALLHSNNSSSATVYGAAISNPDLPPSHQPTPIIDLPGSTGYADYYDKFQGFLSQIFLAKVQNLGTTKKLPISFENFVNQATGYVEGQSVKNYVNKSIVLNVTNKLFTGINSDPRGKQNSFSYIQPDSGSNSTSLNFSGDSSGIIYCEGDLNITGSGTFKGAIICEGNLSVSGVNISYDKGVIQSVFDSDDVAYNFFSKLICFEDPADTTKGFVDKSAILNSDGSLRSGIGSDPSVSGMLKSFSYVQQSNNDTYELKPGNYSGILYCEGKLNIDPNVSFNGAIICEGNVEVNGNSSITYDEGVIQSVLIANGDAREFFLPGAMGLYNEKSYTTVAYDGAVRQATVKRFQIVEWKEGQQS